MKRSMSAGGNGELRSSRSTSGSPVSDADPYQVRRSRVSDVRHIPRLQELLFEAWRSGAIVSRRSPAELEAAIRDRRAVFAMRGELLIGVGIAHPWQEDRFVSHSEMVVARGFRQRGLARRIKSKLIEISRRRWPGAIILSLTLSPEIEKLNKSSGYEPVPYCDLPTDPAFWRGCDGCVHYGHLKRNQYQDCHCWAGLLTPPGVERDRVVPKDALKRPENDSFYSKRRLG